MELQIEKFSNDNFTTTDLTSKNAQLEINQEIDTYLQEARFNYVVTVDNLAQVKKDNADFNKTAKHITEFAKILITKETETVDKFKKQIAEYKAKIESKRLERVAMVESFENETKETIKELLEDYTQKMIATHNLRKEFDTIKTDDLIKLANITKSGALTKGAKDGVEAKIQKCLSLQNRYDLRVSNLKVICYEKGLEVPLTENYVQGIIYTDDEADYQTKLNCMIDDEVIRLAQIKKEIEAKAQKEEKEEAKQVEQEENVSGIKVVDKTTVEHNHTLQTEVQNITIASYEEPTTEESQATHGKYVEPVPVKDGKKIVTIQVDLQFLVKNSVADTRILDKVNEMLKNAGFSESIKSVNIIQGN